MKKLVLFIIAVTAAQIAVCAKLDPCLTDRRRLPQLRDIVRRSGCLRFGKQFCIAHLPENLRFGSGKGGLFAAACTPEQFCRFKGCMPETAVRQIVDAGAGGTHCQIDLRLKTVHGLCFAAFLGFGIREIREAFVFALIRLTGTIRHAAFRCILCRDSGCKAFQFKHG